MKHVYTLRSLVIPSILALAALWSGRAVGASADNCSALAPANEYPVNQSCVATAFNKPATYTNDFTATGCNGTNNDDAWGYFVATSTRTTITYTPTTNNGILHLYTGTCGSLVQVGCANNGGNGVAETITLATSIGTQYIFRTQRLASDALLNGFICVYNSEADVVWPGFDLGEVNCPASLTKAGSTTSAVSDCAVRASADHIYQFTTTSVMDLTIDICTGTTYDSFIYLYPLSAGACASAAAAITFDDDWCGTYIGPSRMFASELPIGTYVVVIEGYGAGDDGDYTLTISQGYGPIMTQYFESPNNTWTYTGSPTINMGAGGGETPANQKILSGTSSWEVSNTTQTIDLANIPSSVWEDYTNVRITARVSSTSSNGSNGAENTDIVRFFVALNGGAFPGTADITIAGNNNARWAYDLGLGIASTTAGTPASFAPAAGGTRNNDGYSRVIINIPNGTTSAALRISAINNAAQERWNIENIQLEGQRCQNIYYSRANGSETNNIWANTPTGTAGAATFTKHTSCVVQSPDVVTSTGAAWKVKNLTVNNGGTLVLPSTTPLSVYGDLALNGGFTANNSTVSMVGTTAQTISGTGPQNLYNLTVNNTAGVTSTLTPMNINATLQLTNGNLNTTGTTVVLISNASSTARLGAVAGTASYTGNLTMQRYIPAGVTNWRLLCSPNIGRYVTSWTDDFITAGFPGSTWPGFEDPPGTPWPSVRHYTESVAGVRLNGLVGVPSTAQPLTLGKGFAAWSGDNLNTTNAFVVDLPGPPHILTSAFTLPMTYTNTGSPAEDGWNLVGNPVPSAIDFTLVSKGANVDNFYYVFDPISGNNATWNETAGTSIPGGSLNGNIQSSQAFWLHASGAAITTTVTESAKVLDLSGGGLFGGDQNGPQPWVRLKLYSALNTFFDETLVHFGVGDPNTTSDDIDKFVFSHPSAPQIASLSADGTAMIFNAWGEPALGTAIPVTVDVPLTGDYTIRVHDAAGIMGISCLVLEDLSTGISTFLTEGAEYTFTIDANDPVTPARFVLHASEPVDLTTADVACASFNDGSITVQGVGAGPWDYTLLDGFGNVITTVLASTGSETFSGLSAGDYSVQVSSDAGCGTLTSTVHIDEPLPLDGTAISNETQCAATQDGSIDLTVMGGTGPYLYDWSNGSTDEDLANVAPGSYDVTITDAHGCEWTSAALQVNAGAGPQAGFVPSETIVLVGDTVSFFNTSTFFLQYSWDFGDGFGSNDMEPEHAFDLPGTYTVTLTVTDGLCTAVFSMDIEVNMSTGIGAAGGTGAVNAWAEQDQFVVTWPVMAGGSTADLEVMDAQGRMVMRDRVSLADGRAMLTTVELRDGIYLLTFRTAEESHTFKLPLAR